MRVSYPCRREHLLQHSLCVPMQVRVSSASASSHRFRQVCTLMSREPLLLLMSLLLVLWGNLPPTQLCMHVPSVADTHCTLWVSLLCSHMPVS